MNANATRTALRERFAAFAAFLCNSAGRRSWPALWRSSHRWPPPRKAMPSASGLRIELTPLDWSLLSGNTHPLARAQYDQGAAPPNLPMDRIQLVLKRSPDQEAGLQDLLEQQQVKSSRKLPQVANPRSIRAAIRTRRRGHSGRYILACVFWISIHQRFEGTHVD